MGKMKKRILPLYYCQCCMGCKYRSASMKTLFDDSWLDKCADTNGINIVTIIPKVLYVINWCKRKK